MLGKIFKNILDFSLLIAKIITEKYLSSCNSFLNNKGILKLALPCHAPRDDDPASTMYL